MTVPEAALLALAESIADGSAIDWHDAERRSRVDHRAIVRQLKVIAELATLHRTMPADPAALPGALVSRRLSATPAVGRWAHLDLIERLGGGTFGEVYRAFDRHLERDVALKLLRSDATPEDDFQSSRILAEGRRLARLHHPNVVTVYGAAMHEGRVGLWMELVKGSTLEHLVQKNGAMSATEAAVVGIDLCRALAALHQAGLIHRDIKTQNVMRADGGRIVLMDLGTGRLLAPGTDAAGPDLAGTPLYLAPEIFDGAAAGPRTDLYSLGVTLYRLVTNAFPVNAATVDELKGKHAAGNVARLRDVRPDLPSGFVRVVERAIAPDPQLRYSSAGELEADLVAARDEAQAARKAARRRRPWWGGAALAMAAVAALAIDLWGLRPAAVSRSEALPPGAIRSIAVLPLVNLSGDPSQEYFADGMTDELIGTLGRLRDVKVISRTSAMRFKGSKQPLPEIARALHVDAVLEGSVAVSPGAASAARRVRINARLIYAGTDTQMWDRTFETVVSDVVALQSQVAHAVAAGMSARLSSSIAGTPVQKDFDAFDLYLKGRYSWNTRTADGLRESVDYFTKAIARDGTFAAAYAGLADAFNMLGDYGLIARADAQRQAESNATKALTLDESLAEAHASLAFVRLNRFDWSGAESAFKRALALNNGYATAHQWYAFFLAQQGRFEEALREAAAGVSLDPLSPGVNAMYGYVLTDARRYDEALNQYLRTAALSPTFHHADSDLAKTYLLYGDRQRAISHADKAAAAGATDPFVLGDIGHVYAAAGQRVRAASIIDGLARRYENHEDGLAMAIATIYAGLGDADHTFEWLDRARAVADPVVADIKSDPRFDPVRRDPRFAKLLASVGLTL